MLRCQDHRDRTQGYLFLQIRHEPTLDVPAERDLRYDFSTRDYIRGPWRRAAQPLTSGLYCAHCLRQGATEPLPYDEIDLEDEGLLDPALLFKSASDFTIAEVWDSLVARFGDNIVDYRDFPAQPPVYAGLGDHVVLDPALRATLFGRVLPPGGKLYRHQTEAIDAIYRGEHVTIVTATASGKTLTYAVPVLDAVLRDAQATALYLAPLNALAEDQLDAFTTFDQSGRNWTEAIRNNGSLQYLRDITIGERSVRVARYDGNVPEGERPAIRAERPNWVITNPEMLHQAMLSWGGSDRHWRWFFKNLRFVIIDEMHTYKGIFGSNFANLMRRLQRLCFYLGAKPQFICASATIKNPGELAKALTGHQHTVIGQERDGSPRRLRRFVLWDS
ncbi:MAG TPA: DEAD/DEAH box helicase, partial [Roseiflexaceae bacterium]